MSSQTPIESLPPRLVSQIVSLPDGFRTLSKASTLQEMGTRFLTLAGEALRGATMSILHLPVSANGWVALAGNGTHPGADLLRVPSQDTTTLCTLDQDRKTIVAVQRLVDGSHVGVVTSAASGSETFSPVDTGSLQLSLHLFDAAFQAMRTRLNEKDLVFSLNHRILQLNSLIDTGIEVARLDQAGSLQQLALERAVSLTNASRGMVEIFAGDSLRERLVFPPGDNRATAPGQGLQIASSFTFGEQSYQFSLFEKESRRGILPFEGTDQLLLDALARQVHASLENRYLLQQRLEKQRMEQDLAVAASIQQRILPEKLPVISGYDIAGINIPSKSVGGDYYDCIPLPDGRYALVIADVAGKGIPAALLVSSLHAYLSAFLANQVPLVELVRRLNRAMAQASTDDKFITAFFGILSPATGEMESVNAGHTPSYLLRNDHSIHELNAGGIPLGMLDLDLPIESEQVTIRPGERLLLYTDGVTEATNEESVLFDTAVPLRDFVARQKPHTATIFIDELVAGIKSFTGQAPQNDDITALYLLRS